MENLLTPKARDEDKGPATKAFDSVTNAYTQQFGETLNSTFRALDNTQRGLVSLMFSFFAIAPSAKKERKPEPECAEPRVVTDIDWSSEPVRTGTY